MTAGDANRPQFAEAQDTGDHDAAHHDMGRRLAAHYQRIYEMSMRDMRVCNPALRVEAIGFRPFGALAIGIVTTPWFMNIVAVPMPDCGRDLSDPDGATRRIAFPAGDVDFIAGTLTGFGPLLSASLFSPMFDFADMEVVRQTAEGIVTGLFDPHFLENKTPARPPAAIDRRAFLRGRLSGEAQRP